MQLNAHCQSRGYLGAHALIVNGDTRVAGKRGYPSQASKTLAMKSCDEVITVLLAYQSPCNLAGLRHASRYRRFSDLIAL